MTFQEILQQERGQTLQEGDKEARSIKSGKVSFEEKYRGLPETIESFNTTDFVHLFMKATGCVITSYAKDSAAIKKCMNTFNLSKEQMLELIEYLPKQKRIALEGISPTILTSRWVLVFLDEMEGKTVAKRSQKNEEKPSEANAGGRKKGVFID